MKLEEMNRRFEEIRKQQKFADPSEEEIIENEEIREDERNKKHIILIAVLIILLGITAAITIPMISGTQQKTAESENIEGKIMTGYPKSLEEGIVEEVSQQQIGDSVFSVCINALPVFQNGDAIGNVYIINSEQNQYPCKVTITLNEDSTVLFKSGDLLYPNQYIQEIKLWKSLSKGVYDATITYVIYEEDGETQAGIVSTEMRIVIQN